MQRLAKCLALIMLAGIAVLAVEPPTGSCHSFIHKNSATIMENSDKQDSSFWEKFRESVQPREDNPKEKPPPKEKTPVESPPTETHPEESED